MLAEKCIKIRSLPSLWSTWKITWVIFWTSRCFRGVNRHFSIILCLEFHILFLIGSLVFIRELLPEFPCFLGNSSGLLSSLKMRAVVLCDGSPIFIEPEHISSRRTLWSIGILRLLGLTRLGSWLRVNLLECANQFVLGQTNNFTISIAELLHEGRDDRLS